MKKLIYGFCAAALVTACTNEDLIQEDALIKSQKGITFEASIAEENPETRGELTQNDLGSWSFFWYAERDRINVYALDTYLDGTALDAWGNAGTFTAPVYKATKSAGRGQFTATKDADILSFNQNDKNVEFLATYPTTTRVYDVETNTDGTVKKYGLKVAANMIQNVDYNQIAAPMVSKTTAKRDKSYESVGEKVTLDFTRPFPAVRFSTVKNNEQFNTYLGNLNSITLTTKGGKVNNVAQSATTIGSTGVAQVDKNGNWTDKDANEVTVNLATQKEWIAGEHVFMSILPVVRKQSVTIDDKKYDLNEKYTVTYNFDNVTLAKEFETTNDWNFAHGIGTMEAFDIAKDFPYIVTNDSKTLIVFSQSFGSIFADNTKNTIKWTAGNVDVTSIQNIVVEAGVTVTTADMQSLYKFTGLKNLTMKGVTSIPENTFDAALAAGITKLELPAVTEIAAKGNVAFSALTDLNLESYAFGVAGIEALFFNEGIKGSLVNLNIKAVTSLRPTFGAYRTIYFTDYANLETVKLNETGVALTSDAFKGCASLTTVNGKVDISNAPNAFEGTAALSTVNVINKIIPNAAFKNSAVKNIKLGNSQVVPTEVGEYAFSGNVAIEVLDLSETNTIGKYAFSGAEKYVGVKDNNNVPSVLTVKAAEVSERAFNGSAIEYIQFVNLTTLNDKVLRNCANLKQVKFLEVISLADGAAPFELVTTNKVDLFVVTEQADVNGNTWNLVGKTFKSITKEDNAWGM